MLETIGTFAGTVGVVLLAFVAFRVVYRLGHRALSGGISDHESALSATGGPSGQLARHVGWQDQRALHTLSQDQQRRLADRRREASEIAIHRAATSAREPLGQSGSDAA